MTLRANQQGMIIMFNQAPFGLNRTDGRQPSSSAASSASSSADNLAGTQRAHTRYMWDREVQVSWLTDEAPMEPIMVQTADLSAGGLSLLTRGMVHNGRRGIVLLVKKGGEPMLRCFEVIHCRYVGQSRHVVGARWAPLPVHCPLDIEMTEHGPRLCVKKWEEKKSA